MERIEKTIEVDCPIRAVCNQWTQFEEFSRFMEGVGPARTLARLRCRVAWNAGATVTGHGV